ncbi:MAG: flippase-like domain-containing protein [Actinomycetota bacterium]|nr:flippase-like domain-containing protein [Actinomycetota bacterium]
MARPEQHSHPAAGAVGDPVTGRSTRQRLMVLLKIFGFVVAIVAVFFCVRVLVQQWPTIRDSLRHANIGLLAAGLLLAALGVSLLAVLWWRCLVVFGTRRGLFRVMGWYFGGELGKYLPGGIWPVVGRSELARRGGVPRSTAYATTLMSLALMCVGGSVACGLMVPFFAFGDGRLGPELLLIALVPTGIVVVHPAIFGRLLAVVARVSKGRITLEAPSWRGMLGLICVGVPPWFAVGGASVAITSALGYEQQPVRLACAAVVAWIIGFLALPVPAGAGIREVLFVLASGLVSGPAAGVAAIARVFFIVVDGIGGILGLAAQRRAAGNSERDIITAETEGEVDV